MNHDEQFLKYEIVPTLSSKKPWSSVRCWPRSLSVSRSVSSSSATNATAHKFSIFPMLNFLRTGMENVKMEWILNLNAISKA